MIRQGVLEFVEPWRAWVVLQGAARPPAGGSSFAPPSRFAQTLRAGPGAASSPRQRLSFGPLGLLGRIRPSTAARGAGSVAYWITITK